MTAKAREIVGDAQENKQEQAEREAFRGSHRELHKQVGT